MAVFFAGTNFMLANLFSMGKFGSGSMGSLLEGTPYSPLVAVATVPWAATSADTPCSSDKHAS